MKKLRKNDGFSILEVMVSIIILSLSLVLLLNMAMVALSANNWSNQATDHRTANARSQKSAAH